MPGSTLYGVFRAIDGDLVIAAQVDDAWKRFASLIEASGGPRGFGTDERFHHSVGRNTHRLDILGVVEPWSPHGTQILELLDGIDVPCAKVQRIDEVIADPQIQARGMIVEQEHPRYGTLRLPNLPFRFRDAIPRSARLPRSGAQHNAEVAQSLGFTPAEIDAMQTDGVLFDK